MEKEVVSWGQIALESLARFWPVWIGLLVIIGGGWFVRGRLGTFGRIWGSRIGLVGLGVVLFWVLTAIFADVIAPYGPRAVPSDLMAVVQLKKGPPGIVNPADGVIWVWGGDNNARDIFSRVVHGSRIVLIIAPAATLIAYMVGITLGLPAGYYTGRIDTVLSFLANLVLAFPVILLFYLLVTPEIRQPTFYHLFEFRLPRYLLFGILAVMIVMLTLTIARPYFEKPEKSTEDRISILAIIGGGFCVLLLFLYRNFDSELGSFVIVDVTMPWSIPIGMAAIFFIFPIIFLCLLWFTKHEKAGGHLFLYIGLTTIIGIWLYLGIVFDSAVGPVSLDPNELNVFAAVVFASSPGVFRIVRGLAMDIKTRDYVAAAQTRGERPWYIMLWEILPNARGPLIVDFCLRVGYTTILLGTLGFFGLGLEPESPDWGSMINHGRSFVRLANTAHMALFPAVALMSLVLGLNLLADGMREESLRD